MEKVKQFRQLVWDRLGDISLATWLLQQLGGIGALLSLGFAIAVGVWTMVSGFGVVNALILAVIVLCIASTGIAALRWLQEPMPDVVVGNPAFVDHNSALGLRMQEWHHPAIVFQRCTVTNRANKPVSLQFAAVLRSSEGRIKLPYRKCYIAKCGPQLRYTRSVLNIEPDSPPATVNIAFLISATEMKTLTGARSKVDDLPNPDFQYTLIARNTRTGKRTLQIGQPSWAT